MARPLPFIHKLLSRLERVDKLTVQNYIQDLALENQTLRDLLEQLSEAVFLFKADGSLLYVNRRAAEWFRLDRDHLGRRTILEALTDESLRGFLKAHTAARGQSASADLRLFDPQPLEVRVLLVPLGEGDLFSLLLAESSARNFSTQPLGVARQESLVRLAAGVAHEIGNPLNAVMIHLELLKKDLERIAGSKQPEFLDRLKVVRAETERLDKIVRNFLRAARKPPLRFRSEDLRRVIQGAIDFMRPEFQKHGVLTECRLDTKIEPFLFDPERLHEVFINLFKNALEAMSSGGRLRVAAVLKGRVVVVRVRDDGAGIPDADLPHVFEAYYTTKPEGSGLGLWMVYQAIAEHGGRIDVSTKESSGTTFTLFIPVRREKLQLPPAETAAGRGR
jgi:signal transduction histidine kinase